MLRAVSQFKPALVIAALAALCVPGAAQQLQPGSEAAALEIGTVCAEMWGARTLDELGKLQEDAGNRTFIALNDAAAAYATSNLEYDAARKEYEMAYDALTITLNQMALQGIDLATKGVLEALAPVDPDSTSAMLDAAIALGTEGAAALLDFQRTNTENDALLEAQFARRAELIEKRKAYLRANAEVDRIYAISTAVDVCAEDQASWLRTRAIEAAKAAIDEAKPIAGREPTPPPPPVAPPAAGTVSLPKIGDVGPVGLGFKETPGNQVGVATPEECRDICLKDTGCMAWNYLPPYDATAGVPARCELYDDNTFVFTADRSSEPAFAGYVSGFGPGAIAKGFAEAK